MKIYYIKYVWLPFRPPYKAITIPPFGIFIRSKYCDNKKILNHEMIHWKQYQELGLLKFYWQYFKQFLKFGYDRMPMEIEARNGGIN